MPQLARMDIQRWHDSGDFAGRAFAHLEQLPDDGPVWTALGEHFLKEQKFRTAAAAFHNALVIGGTDPSPWLGYARAAAALGHTADAEKRIEAARNFFGNVSPENKDREENMRLIDQAARDIQRASSLHEAPPHIDDVNEMHRIKGWLFATRNIGPPLPQTQQHTAMKPEPVRSAPEPIRKPIIRPSAPPKPGRAELIERTRPQELQFIKQAIAAVKERNTEKLAAVIYDIRDMPLTFDRACFARDLVLLGGMTGRGFSTAMAQVMRQLPRNEQNELRLPELYKAHRAQPSDMQRYAADFLEKAEAYAQTFQYRAPLIPLSEQARKRGE